MKKKHLILLFALASLFCRQAYSQQADSIKQAKISYISKDLGLDKIKAEKVVDVMDDYKQKAKAVIEDKNLKEAEKRSRLNLLIDEKNADLQKLLTEQQLQKFVSTTERNKDKNIPEKPKGK